MQPSGILHHTSDLPSPDPGLALWPSFQELQRKPAPCLAALCVSEHRAGPFGKQVWMRRGCLVNQGYPKIQPENLRNHVMGRGP